MSLIETNVLPIFKCGCCGKPGEQIELHCVDGTKTNIYSCFSCLSQIEENLKKVRPVFDLMLLVGINKDIAGKTMTFLLDQNPFGEVHCD